MAEEPTLPSLPKVSWDSETQTFNCTRKRNRAASIAPPLFTNSSDPAVFSSDDDPTVENYINGRHRKRRYYGSWFQQLPASSDSAFGEDRGAPLPKPKRTLERQVDSGVWMGSDASIDLDDELSIHLEAPRESRLPQLRNPTLAASPDEAMIHRKIETAIDEGNSDVDLSSLNISHVSNETIGRLSELSLIPSVNKDVPFEQKNPDLGVYLYGNQLTQAPGALFTLQHLTYLSLRNNQISELPASIGQLHNLRELNISLNRLRYLPGELLHLLRHPSKLETLNVHPNPFYRPDCALPDKAQMLRTSHLPKQWILMVCARSPVQYSSSRGIVLSKDFRLPCADADEKQGQGERGGEPVLMRTEDRATRPVPKLPDRNVYDSANRGSRVLSLFEVASQACSRAAQTWELAPYLPEPSPSSLSACLGRITEQGYRNANSGTVPCSLCGRRVVTPTAQWIEWWDIAQAGEVSSAAPEPLSKDAYENAVPFLWRGCSWACVPNALEGEQLAVGCE